MFVRVVNEEEEEARAGVEVKVEKKDWLCDLPDLSVSGQNVVRRR